MLGRKESTTSGGRGGSGLICGVRILSPLHTRYDINARNIIQDTQ